MSLPLSVQRTQSTHLGCKPSTSPPTQLASWLGAAHSPAPRCPPCRDGDVYIGSNWNELSIGMLIIFIIPLLGLLFAWATYGTLWATGEFY